jgi:hypothetical protein
MGWTEIRPGVGLVSIEAVCASVYPVGRVNPKYVCGVTFNSHVLRRLGWQEDLRVRADLGHDEHEGLVRLSVDPDGGYEFSSNYGSGGSKRAIAKITLKLPNLPQRKTAKIFLEYVIDDGAITLMLPKEWPEFNKALPIGERPKGFPWTKAVKAEKPQNSRVATKVGLEGGLGASKPEKGLETPLKTSGEVVVKAPKPAVVVIRDDKAKNSAIDPHPGAPCNERATDGGQEPAAVIVKPDVLKMLQDGGAVDSDGSLIESSAPLPVPAEDKGLPALDPELVAKAVQKAIDAEASAPAAGPLAVKAIPTPEARETVKSAPSNEPPYSWRGTPKPEPSIERGAMAGDYFIRGMFRKRMQPAQAAILKTVLATTSVVSPDAIGLAVSKVAKTSPMDAKRHLGNWIEDVNGAIERSGAWIQKDGDGYSLFPKLHT